MDGHTRPGATGAGPSTLTWVSFEVSAGAYLRFMGKYSEPLAGQFADLAGIGAGLRVLDVGCGPGALTAELVRRVGPSAVRAVEPSAPFAAAARERLPGVDIQQATAEHLPFADASFDAALAQLVVHFMTDPVQGLREMGRVTQPGGTVGACVWDHAGGRGPLGAFWQAVRELDPDGRLTSPACPVSGTGIWPGCSDRPGSAGGVSTLTVRVRQASFDEWWDPFLLDVGPAGAYVARLPADASGRAARAVPAAAAARPDRDQRHRMGGGQFPMIVVNKGTKWH